MSCSKANIPAAPLIYERHYGPPLEFRVGTRTGPRVLAMLGYELLGGIRGDSASRWTPLPGLSAEGNASLRRAIERPDAYESAIELVDALRAEATPSHRRASRNGMPRRLTASQVVQTSPQRPPPISDKPHFAARLRCHRLVRDIRRPAGRNRILAHAPSGGCHPGARPEPAPTQEKTVSIEKPAQEKTSEKPGKKLIRPRLFCLLPKRPRGETTTPKRFENFSKPSTRLPKRRDPRTKWK